ncbi:signal peptidase I [Labrys miyagiensis]|uniref:Signal peptidase I n=1 Tax=Labrys miyagiensis TaxID=346912 RepID=A0ABQ6CWZ5_9HYPH|nr:signal peptidase I [Labrys miyagiensis]GLS24199.1 signal peptidase I [Labrys miyagiensis]
MAILVLAAVVAAAQPRAFSIPSGSNIPTLLVGDVIMAGRFSYGVSAGSLGFPAGLFKGRLLASDPQQGDIAFFLFPHDPSVIYVKRVIGMPGDRVQMKEGRLYLNGTMVPRQEDGTYALKDMFGRKQDVPKYIETLPNGVKYDIIEIQGDVGFYDNTQEFLVPPGQYFTMGDNRDNSEDSRDMTASGVGFVPADNFIAKAWAVLYSTSSEPGRTFKPIQ